MPREQTLTSQIYIKLNGTAVQQPVMQNMAELVVDQHSHLPDMFMIRLQDPNLELLDDGPFDLTKEAEIEAESADGNKVVLMKGEITALEPQFDEGMIAEFIVRGYDRSHRLFRETKSRAFLNKKDSDLANEVAQAVGLQAQVDTTNTVYDHIYQHNQSDLHFLMERAWRIGFECFVTDGKLYFRKPTTSSAQVTLKWGEDLLTFSPRMTLAEQVDEVVVKGWDAEKQEAIVGQASNGRLYPEIEESKDGKQWASSFGTGKLVITDQPVVSQAEANALAEARLNELSGAFVAAEGVAFRRPDIKAGQMIKLEGLGKRLSGTYLVTNARHIYSDEGMKTHFAVRGSRTGLLAEQITHERPQTQYPGVVTAVVTNTDDPQNWGRVKVKFPWMTDDAESDWARLTAPGAGPEAGLCFIPEVDDEVVVAFEQGDFGRPYVLGGLWNGRDKLPPETEGAGGGEKPLVRAWHSRTGHLMAMYDNSDNKIEIITQGGHKIVMDDAGKKIEIASSGGLKITMDDNGSKIALESGNSVEIKSSANMKIEAGGNLDIQASGQVNIKGAMVNLN